ncbi:hypothetical protein HK104_000339 [Borealophlyctis nickersoniae]|nr:hypothetical protein HK104_000339 [Borealophlyctis nickersoniae]
MGKYVPEFVKRHEYKQVWKQKVLGMVIFTYMPILQPAIKMLSCTQIGSKSVMRDLPSMECWTGRHLQLAAWAGFVLIVWGIVVPAGIGYCLYVAVRQLMSKKSGDGDPEGMNALVEHHEHGLHVLYHDYKPKYFYWLIPDLYTRIAISLAASLTDRLANSHSISVTITVLLFATLHYAIHPCRSQTDNFSRSVTYTALLALGVTQALPYDPTPESAATMAGSFPLVLPAVLLPVSAWSGMVEKYRNREGLGGGVGGRVLRWVFERVDKVRKVQTVTTEIVERSMVNMNGSVERGIDGRRSTVENRSARSVDMAMGRRSSSKSKGFHEDKNGMVASNSGGHLAVPTISIIKSSEASTDSEAL